MVAGEVTRPVAVVVQCHPVEDSYNAAVLGVATETLAPEFDVRDFRLYSGQWPMQDDLRAADTLVLVYPTWWGGMPGHLLSWMQNALGPHLDGEAGIDTSPLRELRRVVALTTHGSPQLMNRIQGEVGRRLLKRVAKECTRGAVFVWAPLYGLDAGPHVRREYLSTASRVLRDTR